MYRLNGDNIGQIERVMIDKISGKAASDERSRKRGATWRVVGVKRSAVGRDDA